jgi:hypothetical protein
MPMNDMLRGFMQGRQMQPGFAPGEPPPGTGMPLPPMPRPPMPSTYEMPIPMPIPRPPIRLPRRPPNDYPSPGPIQGPSAPDIVGDQRPRVPYEPPQDGMVRLKRNRY